MNLKTCPALAGFIIYWIEVIDFEHQGVSNFFLTQAQVEVKQG